MTIRSWWTAWGGVVWKLFALVASFASLSGLLVAFLPPSRNLPWWALALLVSAGVFFVALVVFVFLERRGRSVYAKTDTDGIKRYMHSWIEDAGRVVLWTRDMSWAQNPETRTLLLAKASRNELIICLPESNELTLELADAGAEVCVYGAGLLESPASRFTISFFGRDGSRVAVGRAEGDAHVIDEFSAGGHPAYHLAADLVAMARALEGRANQ